MKISKEKDVIEIKNGNYLLISKEDKLDLMELNHMNVIVKCYELKENKELKKFLYGYFCSILQHNEFMLSQHEYIGKLLDYQLKNHQIIVELITKISLMNRKGENND